MVTQKEEIIPIYDFSLYIIVYDSPEEILDIAKLPKDVKGFTKLYDDDLSRATVAISSKFGLDTISHETVHIVNRIWLYIGYKPSITNDEVSAYLNAYIVKVIAKVVNNHKLEKLRVENV